MSANIEHAFRTEARFAIALRRLRAIAADADRSEASRLTRALSDIDAACLTIALIDTEIHERRRAK